MSASTDYERDKESANELFPIGAVSDLTGVNSITLRAWETRYGLIEPLRTGGGHRLYSRQDIDVIVKAVGMIGKGMTISQVAEYFVSPDTSAFMAADEEDIWAHYRHRILDAVRRFDSSGLEDVYQGALSLHPVQTVIRLLILPSLQELGERWKTAAAGIAEEHFFSVFLRNKLGARFHHRGNAASGPKLLSSCFPNESHEAGLLLFSLAADERNYRQILLGANMPLAQLPAAVSQSKADAIVLSGKTRLDRNTIGKDLVNLVLLAGVPVFVGGDVCLYQQKSFTSAGCIVLGADIDSGLIVLDAHFNPRKRR